MTQSVPMVLAGLLIFPIVGCQKSLPAPATPSKTSLAIHRVEVPPHSVPKDWIRWHVHHENNDGDYYVSLPQGWAPKDCKQVGQSDSEFFYNGNEELTAGYGVNQRPELWEFMTEKEAENIVQKTKSLHIQPVSHGGWVGFSAQTHISQNVGIIAKSQMTIAITDRKDSKIVDLGTKKGPATLTMDQLWQILDSLSLPVSR